ncbi:MAG: sensor domain-containing protein [Propionibacteriaceae bacterium]|jgi:signal transduction histidine kinase|nr:sensor domain-containing protein [Propionibacteriaceae bacterium]
MVENLAPPRPPYSTLSVGVKNDRPARGFRGWLLDLAYVSFNAVAGLASAIIVIVFLTVGFPLILITVGGLLVALGFVLAHLYGMAQRGFLQALGRPTAGPLPPVQARGKNLLAWAAAHLSSSRRWREAGLASFGALAQSVLSLIGLSWIGFGIEEAIGPLSDNVHGLFEELLTRFPGWFDLPLGAFFVLTWPVVVWCCARADAFIARVFLVSDGQAMAERIEHLRETRAGADKAESQRLRQLERDLHDGPQQRLIRTGMDLASAQRRLASGDLAQAQTLLAEAQARNEETICELRQLSRGFAPPILAEQGLGPALTSLAGSAPLPVKLDLDQRPPRYSEAVERTVYFGAAEAIANAAKHARASRVELSLHEQGDPAAGLRRLILLVQDDGAGGALPLPGHGLDGLKARVTSVEGIFAVDSPAGAGTVVAITIPLA